MKKLLIPLPYLLDPAKHQTIWFWLKVRALHKNPIIFNYEAKGLGKRIGLSHTCVRKYVRQMEKLGLCSQRDGHLCLTSPHRLKKQRNKNGNPIVHKLIAMPVCATKKEQMVHLRGAIIHNNIVNQQKRIIKKTDTVKICNTEYKKLTPKQLREINKAGGVKEYEKSVINYATLSNKKFGLLIDRAQSTGKKLQKQLRKAGIIRSKPKRIVLVENTTKQAYYHYLKYHPQIGIKFNPATKEITQQLSNSIEMLPKNSPMQKTWVQKFKMASK